MAWQLDTVHSHVQFSVKHMMISKARGQFDKFEVDLDLNERELTLSRVQVRIDAASINTNDAQRDAHLKSPDFLDVEKYPYITFNSKRIEKVSHNHGRIIGDLTIRGITKEVVLDVEYAGQLKNPWGMIVTGASARTRINRKDWGLTWNQALETGGLLVGEELTIDIELELVKQPEAEAVAAA
jgi:polyisoprenoid-binding protein YceI